MITTVARYRLSLLGPFRLENTDGNRIEVSSRKAQALLAALALAGAGERTRSWLQSLLWGSRAPDQAKASLRSELSNLRTSLNLEGISPIGADHSRVWMELAAFEIDARALPPAGGELLEGLDIAGEEAFEDWLRDERARLAGLSRGGREAQVMQEAVLPARSAPDDFAAQPALAILPFSNQSGDPALDYLAEGIGEDLIDRLARLRWLPVIARSSSWAYRDSAADVRSIGEALNAHYVLAGRLRPDGQLSAELADAVSGQSLWSNRIAAAGLAEPDAMDRLLTGMASILGARIDAEEQVRALRKPQSDLNVRELIWRGRWHLNRMTREDSQAAKQCFAEALEREPNSPEAIIQSVWARVWDLWVQRGTEQEIRAMRQMAQKAIIADCDDARGHMLAGIAEIWLLQPMRAEALLRRAIELNPSLVMAHVQLGSSLRLRGENAAAIEALRTAIRLSPNDHDMFFIACELAGALLMNGEHEPALEHAEHAIVRRSAYWFAHVVRINALVRLGRKAEARRALAELHAAKRGFTPDFIDWQPYLDPENNRILKQGLNLAAG